MHRHFRNLHLGHHHKKVEEDTREEILTLPIWTLFRKLAIPAIIGMFMYSIYMFVDLIFVGQWVGTEALAAVSITFPLILVNLVIASFIGMGFSSLISRAIGAKDKKTLASILPSSTLFLVIFSLIYTVLGFVFSKSLVEFMGGSGEILDMGSSYFSIVILGACFFNFVATTTMLIQAEGRMKAAMILVSIGSLLNIILDPIFIEVLNWDIEGAAIATVISMVVTTILTLGFYIFGKSKLSFNLKGLKSAPHLLKVIAPVGASGMALQLLVLIEHVLIYRSVSIYGVDSDLALIGAAMNMISFAGIPLWGIAQGLQPLIGMNYGAKNYVRVKEGFKKFTIGATVIAGVIWLLFMLFPDRILGLYIADSELASSGSGMFRLVMGAFFLRGFISLPVMLFQSIGKGAKAFFMLLSDSVLLFAPVILILPIYLGIHIVLVLHQLKLLGSNNITKNNKTLEGKPHAKS
jgi:putative MATE family efflux protein